MASFYIASKFENKEKVLRLMHELESMDHTITYKWVYQTHAYADDAGQQAQLDYKGIVDCNTLVALFEEEFAYLNAYVELGIALGCDKHIVIIGSCDDKCIFTKLPGITRYDNTEQFLQAVRAMRRPK